MNLRRHFAERAIEALAAHVAAGFTDHAALTYDSVGLLLDAIARGGDDPEAIRDALAETEGYRGASGTITYRHAGGDPAKRLVIGRVQEGAVVIFKRVEPRRPGE